MLSRTWPEVSDVQNVSQWMKKRLYKIKAQIGNVGFLTIRRMEALIAVKFARQHFLYNLPTSGENKDCSTNWMIRLCSFPLNITGQDVFRAPRWQKEAILAIKHITNRQTVKRSSGHSWASSRPAQTNNDPLICFNLWPLTSLTPWTRRGHDLLHRGQNVWSYNDSAGFALGQCCYR